MQTNSLIGKKSKSIPREDMVRLTEPKRKILSPEDFEKYPIWTWDEQMVNVQPISELIPSIYDYVDLFIRATFSTNGYKFKGYLMGAESFYGFVIFIESKRFMFNVNLKSLSKESLGKLFDYLNCKPFGFFPIKYESDVILKETGKIRGTLDFEI